MNDKNKKLLLSKKKNNASSALERYKRRRKKELIIIFILIMLFISIFLFVNSSYVKLKNINITGLEQIDKDELLKDIEINNDTKIWKIKEDELKEKILSSNNIVKDVTIDIKLLQTLNIDLKEKKIVAKEKNLENNNYDILMEDGNYYKKNIKNNFNLPLLEKFQGNDEKRISVIKNLSSLNFEVLIYISEVVNENNDSEEIIIYMKDGQKIKANFLNFYDKLNYYFNIERFIEDKRNTTLNLINGAFLETKSSEKLKETKIKEISISKENNNKKINEETKNTNENNKKDEKNKNN